MTELPPLQVYLMLVYLKSFKARAYFVTMLSRSVYQAVNNFPGELEVGQGEKASSLRRMHDNAWAIRIRFNVCLDFLISSAFL